MVRTGRGKPVCRVILIEKMTLVRQFLIHGFTHDHHTKMRAIYLVKGKQVDVSAEGVNIRQAVPCI